MNVITLGAQLSCVEPELIHPATNWSASLSSHFRDSTCGVTRNSFNNLATSIFHLSEKTDNAEFLSLQEKWKFLNCLCGRELE